ncbi:MAG: FAD-dependent oxidoreductase [Rhodopirellula sp.]|nr:FAD-dependent oxidoreductase [Rhodopirellula sp.]
MMTGRPALKVEIPNSRYHRDLIACQVACPVHTDARGYVRAIAEGRFEEAYLIARGPNPLASICGRVCGAPCEAACRRGKVPRVDADGRFVAEDRPISIRALKRFACDRGGPEVRPTDEVLDALRRYVPHVSADAEEMAALVRAGVEGTFRPAEGQPVAIVGSGPAGLAAAHDLALMGFRPVVFEMERVPAGMLSLGVPAYRLPRDLIAREVAVIEALGVEIRCEMAVGKDVTLADLRRDYAAVILAVGAKASRGLGLPGEQGPRVYGGVDLLRGAALESPPDIGREVVVIGGGNVAFDVARTVVRQIAYDAARTAARLPGTGRVHLTSLETLEEMPADTLEIVEGDEEGIVRHNGWGPIEIQRDETGAVQAVHFRKCLRVYDDQRRFAPVFDDQSRHTIPCDTVLLSVGQAPNLQLLDEGGDDVEQFRPGWPKVDPETLATTAPGVFVAGDLAHGTRLLIDAVASGKKAARSIYEYLTGRKIAIESATAHISLDRYRRELGYEAIRRVPVPVIAPEERLGRPQAVVETGYDEAAAMREASRCLDCGVTPVFDGARCVLCGGCADVCPTQCLKLVSLADLERTADLDAAIREGVGSLFPYRPPTGLDLPNGGEADTEKDSRPPWAAHSAILKDEDRCIRCALCAMRCPSDAITMERVTCTTSWRSL